MNLGQDESTLAFTAVYSLFAMSTYAVLWTGVFSVASVFFGACAGYVYANLFSHFNLGLLVGVPVGMVTGAVAALLVSLIVLHLKSHYMAMATIAIVLISQVLILNITSFTNGAAGMLVTTRASLWVLLVIVAAFGFLFSRLRKSRFGMAAQVVREDPDVARSLGINPIRIRRIGFLISGAVGGAAGVLLADQLQFISPDTYYITLAFTMLASVVLGGAFHWAGGIVGAFVYEFLPLLLQNWVGGDSLIVNGVLLIVIMIYLPRGIVDPGRKLRWPRRRPRSAPQLEAEAQANVS